MNWRVVALLAALAAIAAVIFLLPGREEEKAKLPAGHPEVASQGSGNEQAMPHDHSAHALPLPEVSSITVAIQDSTQKDLGELTLQPGTPQPVPGTVYSVRFTDFYTSFAFEKTPVNSSMEPQNPAVRIEIFRDGKVVDYSWAFEKVPFFRMMGMGGSKPTEQTGLAFSLLKYEGLRIPDSSDPHEH